MKKTDILIIGGGPAGIVAAVTARKNWIIFQKSPSL